jgi:hypothetical protein
MGRDGMDLKDSEVIWGKDVVRIGINIVVFFTIVSISLVCLRRRFSYSLPFVMLLVIYLLGLRHPAFYQTWLKPSAFRIVFLFVTCLFLVGLFSTQTDINGK